MDFTAAQWQRVQELCDSAEGLHPSAREAFLLREEPDPNLRKEVRSILHAITQEQALRERLVPIAGAEEISEQAATTPEAIGPYRVIGLAGVGGFGQVYKAIGKVSGAEREVALKVLRDPMLREGTLERFERERHMLASLDEPRIARLYDAGSTSLGLPYLAMEYVDGQPIDVYCDSRKLSVAARVDLIAQVADVMRYAHSRLVVHLDLKPSNILVKADGTVKLLDFGTAKLLTHNANATATMQLTPAYSSPERLRGDAISVGCDIYSLGLVLYELASGSWPFEMRDSLLGIAERASGTTQPRLLGANVTAEAAGHRNLPLHKLRGSLQGDLEAICAKSLAYRPEDRYPSMEAFHADLKRYLAGEPVSARRQTTIYRFSKYCARHRRALAAAVLAFGVLAASATYSLTLQREKLSAGRQAETMASLLSWAISSSNTLYGGRSGMTVTELVERASARLNRTPQVPPEVRVRLQLAFASYLMQEGKGELADQILADAAGVASASGDANSIIGVSLTQATMATGRGNCNLAVEALRKADAAYERSSADLPPLSRGAYLLIRSEAKTYCEHDAAGSKALMSALPAVLGEIPDDDLTLGMPPRIFKAIVANHQAQDLRLQGRYTEAEDLILKALASAAEEKEAGNARIALLRTLVSVRLERNEPGDLARAAQAMKDAIQIAPGFTSNHEQLRLKTMLATILARAGERQEAVRVAQAAAEEARELAPEMAGQSWMIEVSAAYALAVWAGHCDTVDSMLARARTGIRGEIAPGWRWQMLAAEGACRIDAGERAEGRRLIEEALKVGAIQPETAVYRQLAALQSQ